MEAHRRCRAGLRSAFPPEPALSPEAAVRKAVATPGYPVVITDPADNVGGGGEDNTVMLKTLLEMRGL